jgi:hypothetical protein
MVAINYAAVIVAAIVAFVASVVWYISFGKQMMALRGESSSAMTAMRRPPPSKALAELVRNFVLAFVIAHFVVLLGIRGPIDALQLAFWVWIGFPVMILAGAVMWENMAPRLAMIHAGDWLVKLLLVTIILGVW